MRRFVLVIAALAAAACKPHPKPAPSDTTVVVTPDTMDSVGTDSVLLDQDAGIEDTLGSIPDFDTTAANTLLARPAPRRAGPTTGMGYGLTGVNAGDWCNWVLNATMTSVTPTSAIKALQLAARCNIRVVLVPSQIYLTTTGKPLAPFSMTKAKAFSATLAKTLKPDTLAKYDKWLIGFNLSDDYGSRVRWGGTTVTPAMIAEWAAYSKQVMPTLTIGIRVHPWYLPSAVYAKDLDYAWCQYHTKWGDAQRYYDRCGSVADSYGMKVEMNVNVADCHGVNTAVCTPSELQDYLGKAVRHPKTCATVSWKYSTSNENSTWNGFTKPVHFDLSAIAAARPYTTCKRGDVAVIGDSTPTVAAERRR